MVVGDKRQGCRDVERLAQTHGRPRPQQSLVGRDVARQPRDERPDKKTAANGPAPAETIRHITADRAEESIDPLELPEHVAPLRFQFHAAHVAHDRHLHRCDHLPVEVVEQRDGKKQRDHDPRIAGGGEIVGLQNNPSFSAGIETPNPAKCIARRARMTPPRLGPCIGFISKSPCSWTSQIAWWGRSPRRPPARFLWPSWRPAGPAEPFRGPKHR